MVHLTNDQNNNIVVALIFMIVGHAFVDMTNIEQSCADVITSVFRNHSIECNFHWD